MRYILVLSDTLEYELADAPAGRVFTLTGRPHHRRGAALANECALAAVLSSLRQIHGSRLTPVTVMFRHPGPLDDHHHRSFFGCPIGFEAATTASPPISCIDSTTSRHGPHGDPSSTTSAPRSPRPYPTANPASPGSHDGSA